MKAYLASLTVGFLIGLFYVLVRVKSPAPPLVALTGLLGMVAGESLAPHLGAGAAWLRRIF